MAQILSLSILLSSECWVFFLRLVTSMILQYGCLSSDITTSYNHVQENRKEGWGKALISENSVFPRALWDFYLASYCLNFSHLASRFATRNGWGLWFRLFLELGKEKGNKQWLLGARKFCLPPATDSVPVSLKCSSQP